MSILEVKDFKSTFLTFLREEFGYNILHDNRKVLIKLSERTKIILNGKELIFIFCKEIKKISEKIWKTAKKQQINVSYGFSYSKYPNPKHTTISSPLLDFSLIEEGIDDFHLLIQLVTEDV